MTARPPRPPPHPDHSTCARGTDPPTVGARAHPGAPPRRAPARPGPLHRPAPGRRGALAAGARAPGRPPPTGRPPARPRRRRCGCRARAAPPIPDTASSRRCRGCGWSSCSAPVPSGSSGGCPRAWCSATPGARTPRRPRSGWWRPCWPPSAASRTSSREQAAGALVAEHAAHRWSARGCWSWAPGTSPGRSAGCSTGFDVDLTYVARTARDGVRSIDELPELLPHADVVVLLVPVTPETTGLVDAAFLAAMTDGALLVNAARGVVVDTDALLAELTGRPAACRPRRHRSRAAARGAPAVVGARPAAHPARGRRGARTPNERAAAAVTDQVARVARRGAAAQRGRQVLTHVTACAYHRRS